MDDIFADCPEVTPGKVGWGTLRRLLDWQQRHNIASATHETLDAYREEGYSPAQTGLDLGLIDPSHLGYD